MTSGNWERFARLCDREQNAFLTKLPTEVYDFVAGYSGAITDTAQNPFAAYNAKRWASVCRIWRRFRDEMTDKPV